MAGTDVTEIEFIDRLAEIFAKILLEQEICWEFRHRPEILGRMAYRLASGMAQARRTAMGYPDAE